MEVVHPIMHVKDAAGTAKFTFRDGCRYEVPLQDVAGCAFVQGLLEIAAASSPVILCLSMPAVLQHCLRTWLEVVNAGADGLL